MVSGVAAGTEFRNVTNVRNRGRESWDRKRETMDETVAMGEGV